MTTVQDILTFMEGLAPYELAESWDNVGLLCGDRAQEVTSVLCALDVTETVVQEAAERRLPRSKPLPSVILPKSPVDSIVSYQKPRTKAMQRRRK